MNKCSSSTAIRHQPVCFTLALANQRTGMPPLKIAIVRPSQGSFMKGTKRRNNYDCFEASSIKKHYECL
uniref:Uncharacterized protein n=1 Tax=Anguilla anguilla TaxID=7936 RepID=A0A0E9X281_ANGAN